MLLPSTTISEVTPTLLLKVVIPENVDKPATIMLSESVVLPVTPNVLDNVAAPVNVVTLTVAIPPTIRLSSISKLSSSLLYQQMMNSRY